jgi:hypothetical protein
MGLPRYAWRNSLIRRAARCDQLAPDDIFVLEPARVTSLYHIVGAVAELLAAIPDAGRTAAESRL